MKSPPDKPQQRLPKKNSKANVGQNSAIYFALGLVLMLFVSYQSINYKSYDKSDIDIGALNLEEENEEEIPIIDLVKPPPPPPPLRQRSPTCSEFVAKNEARASTRKGSSRSLFVANYLFSSRLSFLSLVKLYEAV